MKNSVTFDLFRIVTASRNDRGLDALFGLKQTECHKSVSEQVNTGFSQPGQSLLVLRVVLDGFNGFISQNRQNRPFSIRFITGLRQNRSKPCFSGFTGFHTLGTPFQPFPSVLVRISGHPPV